MLTPADIIDFENNYVRAFADVEERDYGVLFYDRDNPVSHDSNHALTLNLQCDLDAAIADVVAFYRALDVKPRVYHGFVSSGSEVLLPRLRAAGFEVEEHYEWFLVCTEPSTITPVQGFELRRMRELTPEVLSVLEPNDTWTQGVFRKQIRRNEWHLMVGFVDGIPVALAELDLAAGLSRVDSVVTHVAHRRHGYGRALMHRVVSHHRSITDNVLYLYSSNPSAIRIYEEAGFRELEWKPRKWMATLTASP